MPPWDGKGNNLAQQLDGISNYLSPWYDGETFPVILCGEHGILPALVQAAGNHPLVDGDFSKLTIVQIDAHADLREELGGAWRQKRQMALLIGDQERQHHHRNRIPGWI